MISAIRVSAQDPLSRYRSIGGGGKSKDSTLKHRTGKEDSVNISYRFLDSSRLRSLDSSIYDFSQRAVLSNTSFNLGNPGNPAKNLVFSTIMNPGFDPGRHAYDIYLFTTDETRFYTTNRPYAELGYLLGTRAEQMINLIYTQNINPTWNFAFQYRLINSPGTYNNQTTNHNNYRFSSWYRSRNKRYQAFLILVGSKLVSAENGGLQNVNNLDSPYTEFFNLPTRIGPQGLYSTNPFQINITTGTFYSTGTYLLRQQYDIVGKKDSIVTDTTVVPLFYPKLRAEYTIQYHNYNYRFQDDQPSTDFYTTYYNFISTPDTFSIAEKWYDLINDFSLYQFPDNKNPQQFIRAGASLEDATGKFTAGTKTLYNVLLHGEYRNRTKNQKWDIEAFGRFYLNGFNAGDYSAYLNLKRMISKKLGSLQLGFMNVNRTLSFSFDRESSFGFGANRTFNKENTLLLFGSIEQPALKLRLFANYYLINNYGYFQDYYIPAQQTSPFTVFQVGGEKLFNLSRNLIWRALVVVQQKAGSSPVNIPFLVTYNQIGYEGSLGFKKLNIAMGAELRYFTNYNADGYSPVTGQFYVQNDSLISEKLPDISAYINFRIRGFALYFRAENLNTLQFNGPNGFGFSNVNMVAPYYPYPGLRIRIGFFWSFVN
jgi:hypothetical protein